MDHAENGNWLILSRNPAFSPFENVSTDDDDSLSISGMNIGIQAKTAANTRYSSFAVLGSLHFEPSVSESKSDKNGATLYHGTMMSRLFGLGLEAGGSATNIGALGTGYSELVDGDPYGIRGTVRGEFPLDCSISVKN